jgi:hypothetical protein
LYVLAARERRGGLYTRDIFHEDTSQYETDGSCSVSLEELSAAQVLFGGVTGSPPTGAPAANAAKAVERA